jgi:DNA-binding MarR family transcriptional regulator
LSSIENSVSYPIAQLAKAHAAAADTLLREIGLRRGQEMVLHQLWLKDGLSQSELAAAHQVRAPTVAKMLNRLAKQGLIIRRLCPEDSRVTRVYLSKRGRQIRHQVEAQWKILDDLTVKGLKPAARKQLLEAIELLRRNLSEAVNGRLGESGADSND